MPTKSPSKTPSAPAVDRAAAGSALVWSKKRPTKEGLYWIRYYGQVKDIVRLKRKEGSITELTQMFYGERVPLRKLPKEWGWEWAGPIPEPIEPNVPALAQSGGEKTSPKESNS